MEGGFFGFFDDYFIKVFVGSSVYEVLRARLPLYYFLIFLYVLYLFRKYRRHRRKRLLGEQLTDLKPSDSSAMSGDSKSPSKALNHRKDKDE
jgi:hypothetical protein